MENTIVKEKICKRERISCIICNENKFKLKYIKRSRNREPFAIVECKNCGLIFVNKRPKKPFLHEYYTMDYFNRRDDRGYANYLSDKVEREFLRVLKMNLEDLDFFPWEENTLNQMKKGEKPGFLDIGAASGIAVKWFQERGWNSSGVEIAKDLATQGMEKFGINIEIGDFLEIDFPGESFQLISMIATIEHLSDPHLFIQKISQILQKNGRLVITTCRVNSWGFRFLFGRNWRFFNVPEHLFYFHSHLLDRLLRENGLQRVKRITYGSGLKAPWKKMGDLFAKYLHMGDMMAMVYEKV